MARTNDNWERLVAGALKKQELWELFHAQSRSPSIRSEASDSDYSSSSGSSYRFHDLPFDEIDVSQDLTKLVLVSDFSPAFDVEQVAVSSSEVLGRGTFGSAYKVVMSNGVTIVVKALRAVGVPESEFKRNMEIIGKVMHENVLALRAYCSFAGQRLMLYDHITEGSVYSLLHGRNGIAEIDWEARLRIAVGAAKGLAEIHAQNGGTLIHGNIKASNIFLDSQGYGIISDLVFATMISTNVKRPAWCYAPEVKNTRDVSQASDVYSFGILLLELLTRKSPVHVPGGPRAIDLVKFVTSIRRKIWASKVYDVDLLKQTNKKEQMVKMLQIGIGCVTKSLKQRPKMSEVVKMLEDISIANNPAAPSSSSPLAPSSLRNDLVFFEGDNFQMFSLEDLLGASAEVLGKGTFGTCYKAVLETGNTVAVKRIKDVTSGSAEFQQQMELIGRIRHDNIAELRAYYYSKDEKFLVYDYYYQGSVSELLHGSFRSPERQPLDLDTRLRIAVGAARGITHIHTQANGRLVHGNVKSSNLFIKGHRYGLISDIGLAKLTGPIQVTGFRASGYHAPEVDSTSKLSQASDVYSFGVVLLELLTGKAPAPLIPINVGDDDVSIVNWVQSATGQDGWTSHEIFNSELLRAGCDEETLVQLLQIAMGCVVTAPEQRHKMHQVVDMLEEVSRFYNLDQPSAKSWDQPSEESRDQPSEESQDQPSAESWNQPSEESRDQLSEESQDQPSEESWDQPFAETRLVDILPTFMP